ncbi:hypothetical protein EUGRSUZ_L00652 [Eucalyptus grandis]|uniref:Uncharacterized protein n=1 Tax=Eucalyptus grandis TaxID=71139 RepID=A0A058ZUX7_EUCGR|nr:hypothetical protein EUGRSUZ_L00652 [Eucalyptus grandis]
MSVWCTNHKFLLQTPISARLSYDYRTTAARPLHDNCTSADLVSGYSKGFDVLGYTPDDPVFSSSRSSTHFILQDMILLEKQIRLFISTAVLLQHGRPNQHGVLAKLALRIKFINREVESFTYIQFKDGTLNIPRLVILEMATSLFLNLGAFEQCHFNCSNDITTYMFFMDDLIDSTEDVRHLHDCGIIRHGLKSDAEVADFFNQICREVDVHTYSSNTWNGWIAILELKSLCNPWSIISLIAAFILHLLTLTRTLYGVFSYYRLGS